MNLLRKMPFLCSSAIYNFKCFLDNLLSFYLMNGVDFYWITPFIFTNRVEDVFFDDVGEWACGSSWHFASSNHHAHCCHTYAHSKELSWPRVSIWFDRVQAGQWDLDRSKCFWSEIPGKKRQNHVSTLCPCHNLPFYDIVRLVSIMMSCNATPQNMIFIN